MKKLLYAVIAMSLLAMYGCSGDSNGFSTVGTPSANSLTPTGSISGNLTDSVDNKPIVGAVVNIGGSSATTDSAGYYRINNLPATQDQVAGVTLVKGAYSVVVDLSRVTAPINMVTPLAGSYLYPLNYYTSVAVEFTSLNDSNPGSGTSPGSTSNSNHATPVTGLMANCSLKIGKISATLVGQVVDATTKLPVGAGFTVGVYPFGANFSINSPAAAIAQTDADGKFTVSNLSAATTYTVGARNADQSISNIVGLGNVGYPGGQNVTTAGEGQSVYYTLASGTPIAVAKQDVSVPQIVSVTPANYSTQPVGSVDVIYTFSSSITQNAYALAVAPTTPGVVAIYNDVAATFVGYKANAVAFNLSWIDDKHLKVTIPSVGVSSIYSVSIANVLANAQFKSLGKAVSGMTKETVTFYTAGGAVAVAPVVAISNANTLDFAGSVNLTWNPAQGAKRYNVYRAARQVFANTSTAINEHSYVLINDPKVSVFGTTYTDTPTNATPPSVSLPFVENPTGNHIKLTYRYIVKSVNSDGVEYASTAVPAADVVAPLCTTTSITPGFSTYILKFNEPMDKAAAQTAANYAFVNLPSVTVVSATYNEATWEVTLKLSGIIDPSVVQRSYIDTGADGILQSVAVTGPGNDIANITLGNGGSNAIGISPGVNGVIDPATVLGGDDTFGTNAVLTGINGISQTAKVGDDVQEIAVGKGKPFVPAIYAGPSLVIKGTRLGDDVLHNNNSTLSVSNVKDVAGNVIKPMTIVIEFTPI